MTEVEVFFNREKMLAQRNEFMSKGLKEAVLVNSMVVRSRDGEPFFTHCDEWLVPSRMADEIKRWVDRFSICSVVGVDGVYRVDAMRDGDGYVEQATIALQSITL